MLLSDILAFMFADVLVSRLKGVLAFHFEPGSHAYEVNFTTELYLYC